MRYAITYTTTDSWESTGTVIVEAACIKDAFDEGLPKALDANGYSFQKICNILQSKMYYATPCDVVDYKVRGEYEESK